MTIQAAAGQLTLEPAQAIALEYLQDIVRQPKIDADSFSKTATSSAERHTATNGEQLVLFNQQLALKISLTRREVYGIEFKQERNALAECEDLNRHEPITDENAIAVALEFAKRYFPRAPFENMELASATRRCGMNVKYVDRFVFRERRDALGTATTFDRLSVELNPSSLDLVSVRYLYSHYDGPLGITASECRKIVERRFGGSSNFKVTSLGLTEYLRDGKEPLPLWVVGYDSGKPNTLGTCSNNGSCFVHAVSGQIARRVSEFE